MMSLRDKKIVITGGSTGIGLAIAKKCAVEGAQVVIAARNKRDLEIALSEVNKISGKGHYSYAVDVSNLNEIKEFSQWCSKNLVQINGLVNCAGIYGPIGKTPEINLNEFKQAIEINFLGTVYMSSVFSGIIKSDTRKKIVNFSGGGAATPFPNYSAYASSKIAIVRYTENLAIELAPDFFDINCVAPGFVITRLHQQTIDAGESAAGKNFYEGTKKQIESGGVSSQKAADLTAFLLSSESDGISGKFISAPWDDWSDKAFQKLLKDDKDFATLRRIDNKSFFKKV